MKTKQLKIVEMFGKSPPDDSVRRITDMTDTEEWGMHIINVPADGSCFFQSIAMCMTESVEVWYDIEELRTLMEVHWENYHETTNEESDGVTSSLVRYMCATNIDNGILDKYNAEAEYRADTLREKGVPVYKSVGQFQDHVMKPDTWADHASFHAFLKSLNYRCAVIVFDPECGGIKYLPPEWTVKKSVYIFLLRKVNHYSVVSISKAGCDLPLCLSYDETKEFLGWLKDTALGAVLCEV